MRHSARCEPAASIRLFLTLLSSFVGSLVSRHSPPTLHTPRSGTVVRPLLAWHADHSIALWFGCPTRLLFAPTAIARFGRPLRGNPPFPVLLSNAGSIAITLFFVASSADSTSVRPACYCCRPHRSLFPSPPRLAALAISLPSLAIALSTRSLRPLAFARTANERVNGAAVQIYDCNGSSAQRWSINRGAGQGQSFAW